MPSKTRRWASGVGGIVAGGYSLPPIMPVTQILFPTKPQSRCTVRQIWESCTENTHTQKKGKQTLCFRIHPARRVFGFCSHACQCVPCRTRTRTVVPARRYGNLFQLFLLLKWFTIALRKKGRRFLSVAHGLTDNKPLFHLDSAALCLHSLTDSRPLAAHCGAIAPGSVLRALSCHVFVQYFNSYSFSEAYKHFIVFYFTFFYI